MEGVPPSSMDDAVNQLELETFNMSELSWSPSEEVPVYQSSMLCNDQAGQNMLVDDNVINDTIQQTTRLPTSFPQTMITMGGLDGASSSWINQNGPNWPQTPSSDQQWTNQLPMSIQVPGMLPQPSMSQCSRQFPYQVPITPNPYDPQSSTMLPESSQTLRHQNSFIHQPQQGYVYMTPNATTSQHGGFNPPAPRSPQFPPHNLQVSGDHNQGQVDQASVIPHIENMQQERLMPLNFDRSTRHHSFIHQPQQGYVYMTSNATTSQHGGFNQPTPRIQYIPNQGQVDQASVIPHIDNMQQENLVPLNFGRSTRSQMENPQVHVLQNQTARPNASDAGPESSLQSQNRGLNTQQMEGVPPSFMEDDVNQLEGVPSLPLEVPVNQSSISCNDQAGQNMLVDNNDSTQQTSQFPSHNHQVSGDHDLLNSNCYDSTFFEPTSSSRQPQQGHVYMTPNTTTSQHGGFNQPGPSLPAPRNQYIPNQGQVDQASVIPNIDNMQQENLVPRNSGKSTRSQMDNLQVQGLQNQTSRPNASNPGPDSSLQSQNRGLNTQQVQRAGRDAFWDYVEEKDDGSMICTFCTRRWANKIPISRFKWHLSGEEGRGVAICRKVTKDVQDAALKAIYESNKRHKSSINVNDHGISTCPQDQNIENENMGGDIGRVQREDQVIEAREGEERISSYAVARNNIVSMTGMRTQEDRVSEGALESRLVTEPVDRALEQSNLAGTAGRTQMGVQGTEEGVGEERIQSHSQAENAMEDTIEGSFRHDAFQPAAGAGSSKSLKCNKTKGVPFPTSSNKPVGKIFEENRTVIWSMLMDDEVSTIGIYGMGGVGKTTLLQHICNELLQRQYDVWWVTVSQDFSINRLQNLIAKRLGLDLSSEDDDLHRAARLSEELGKKQKWILILDDLWNSFELHDVGIHFSLKGCKLILTTRSQTVCAQIDCQRKIEVKPLLEGESWTLFKENLRRQIPLSDEVEGIAKAIARECDGLPLGIITVAGSLRGVDDLHQWRNTLKKLKDSGIGDMKVFKLLRFSFDQLGDSALQQCLLYCALFPEDHMIKREELIGYLIDEGIIKGMGRRQEAFDEGHTMLNRLQNVCLLESSTSYDVKYYVKMHDLIRDMAIQIMQEKSQVIVKVGAKLEELPDAEEYWTENLKIVSLMRNSFEEIPPSHSPMCPNLSTLFLRDNRELRLIADSFFKEFRGLKVLDLSETNIKKLPESISDLVSLTALLLTDCEMLRDVPSLKKLMALKRLDLFQTELETMPQGMECLTNLRCLRMNACYKMEFPSEVLPKLSRLQVLALDVFLITVKGKEVGSLRNLETLECNFEGLSDFVEYLRSRNGIRSLSTCKISVGTINRVDLEYVDCFPSKTVLLGNLSINRDIDFPVKFLNGIQGLYCECIDARSLCDVLSLESATELEHIDIQDCNCMESLVSSSSSWFCFATPPLPSHNGMFSRLKEFYCIKCNSMKKLFPLELLSYLVNLEVIIVDYCERMEEIIGTTDEESSTSNPIAELTLPKLKTLELVDLPELKRICSAKLICNSLEVINVLNCEKLKRMPISLPLLENGQPSPHPSLNRIDAFPEEWWETVVEWEPPNAKEVLRPIVQFW